MEEMNVREDKEKKNGISLRWFFAIAGLAFAALAFVLLLSTYLVGKSYTESQLATEHFVTAEEAAADMRSASDYLTAQARVFVATGDMKYANRFFEETNVTRRRDHALETIRQFLDGTPSYAYLSAALDSSNELLQIECYAMRLASLAYGHETGALPETLRSVTLEETDLGLSAGEQRDRALMMLFDETYQDYKDEISRNISQSVEVLVDEMRVQQQDSADQLLRHIRLQEILIVVILVLALVIIILLAILVSRPIRNYISRIREDEALSEEGASELRFLARTYNQVREQNQKHREQLSYDATHDSLTGVFNRSVFEKLRSRCDERDDAMLIIDLDKFKQINDTYGHDVGDRALCCVSALLQKHFRAEDYVCRLGGDEFAVIMVHVDSSHRGLVEEKVRKINEVLQTPVDGLPPITLSVGVAFKDRQNSTGDIYKDADTALYRTKSVRRGGCEFYE